MKGKANSLLSQIMQLKFVHLLVCVLCALRLLVCSFVYLFIVCVVVGVAKS